VAREAGAGRLVLTHLWPGTDPDEAVRAAAGSYAGEIAVASPGLVAEPGVRGE
jgi:ribonuclease BN (tRNA processing enzyme)